MLESSVVSLLGSVSVFFELFAFRSVGTDEGWAGLLNHPQQDICGNVSHLRRGVEQVIAGHREIAVADMQLDRWRVLATGALPCSAMIAAHAFAQLGQDGCVEGEEDLHAS